MRIICEEVSIKVKRTVTIDGKKKVQTKKFYQTINPFNKNADGAIKNRSDILKELHQEADDWKNNKDNQ